MIKKLIEKLYYKCYPERIPVKNLVWHRNWCDIHHLIYETVIPKEIYFCDNPDNPDIYIQAAKRDALREWSLKLRDDMTVCTDYDPVNQKYHLRVTLDLYRFKGDYRYEDQKIT